MSHPIAKNDGIRRGNMLQMLFSPNMPYRAKNRKFLKFQKKQKIPKILESGPAWAWDLGLPGLY